MVMPRALAALQASRQAPLSASDRAGVMPVKWNQAAPSKMASQSKSLRAAMEMAEYFRS